MQDRARERIFNGNWFQPSPDHDQAEMSPFMKVFWVLTLKIRLHTFILTNYINLDGPGIENFQIIGDAVPREKLFGCGYQVRGNSLCMFQWGQHLQDGTRQYIEGATNPKYAVTADDVDKVISVECIPMDDKGRQFTVHYWQTWKLHLGLPSPTSLSHTHLTGRTERRQSANHRSFSSVRQARDSYAPIQSPARIHALCFMLLGAFSPFRNVMSILMGQSTATSFICSLSG